MPNDFRVLLDTNIIIQLEDDHVISEDLQTLTRICSEKNIQLCIHERTKEDVSRDKNTTRKSITESKLNKYHTIPFTKPPSEVFLKSVGGGASINSEIDNFILFSLHENAVSFLVSEDGGIHKKAQRLGIEDQIFTIKDFVSHLKSVFQQISILSPEIQDTHVGNLKIEDPLFDSLKKTYPEFKDWIKIKCIPHDRMAWVSFLPGGELAAICIYKSEIHQGENKLKLCTFKVSEKAPPYMGEYLLSHALKYASENNFYSTYLTVYCDLDDFPLTNQEKNRLEMFPSWLESFGFERGNELASPGEFEYEKLFTFQDEDQTLSELDFSIKFWPAFKRNSEKPIYVVPIQEKFFEILFPGGALNQFALFSTTANRTIKKVYICKAQTKEIPKGSLLLFYCSQRDHREGEILAVGIAEESWKGHDREHLLSFIGKRSVYSLGQIDQEYFFHPSIQALAIKFRFQSEIKKSLSLSDLLSHKILRGFPQSIVQLDQTQKEQLFTLLKT